MRQSLAFGLLVAAFLSIAGCSAGFLIATMLLDAN